MANVTARFRVRNIEDKNGQVDITLMATKQAEFAGSENPPLFPDAEFPEQMIHLKLISSAVTGIFVPTKDVLVNFNGPA